MSVCQRFLEAALADGVFDKGEKVVYWLLRIFGGC
jgi:hypothetical protein